ncbi:MAG: hypothetical protein R6W73_02385 [Candidatus Saliniplasma sp.]
MKKIDEFYDVMGWKRRLGGLFYKRSEKDRFGKGKIALIFFIAGLLLGIILMEYVIPLILIYI